MAGEDTGRLRAWLLTANTTAPCQLPPGRPATYVFRQLNKQRDHSGEERDR